MTELERFEKMAKLAREREYFENALHDIKDYHFESGTFNLNINSGAYKDNRRYKGLDIEFDKELMKVYLQAEIKRLTKEINELVSGLQVEDQEDERLDFY